MASQELSEFRPPFGMFYGGAWGCIDNGFGELVRISNAAWAAGWNFTHIFGFNEPIGQYSNIDRDSLVTGH